MDLDKLTTPIMNDPSADVNETIPDHSEEEGKQFQWMSPGSGGGMLSVAGAGIRSPGGSTVCVRAKTIKDYEDELTELKRDNFDLRMRIYLLEEQEENTAINVSSLEQAVSGSSVKLPPTFAQLKELYINNSHLKEEISSLKKQLCEKENLLIQAANTMETLENNHLEKLNQIKVETELNCEQLHNTIAQLSQEVMELKESRPPLLCDQKSALFDDSNAIACMAFGLPLPGANLNLEKDETNEMITTMQNQLAKLDMDLKEEFAQRLSCDQKLDMMSIELKQSEDARRLLSDKLKHRESELTKAHKLIEEKCQTLTELMDKINILSASKAISDPSQHEKRPQSDRNASNGADIPLSEFEDQIRRLGEQLKAQKVENIRMQDKNIKAMRTIQGLVKQNKALTKDLEQYKTDGQTVVKENTGDLGESSTLNKDNRITELETEVRILKEKLLAVNFGDDQDESNLPDLTMLQLEIESKNIEIENLNEELKKRTFNLQELVNKELWDKNREIEKLNQVCEKKQTELNNLKQELNGKNQELTKFQEEFKKTTSDQNNSEESFLNNVEFKENKDPNLPLSVIVSEKLKNELKLTIEENNKLKEEVESLSSKSSEQILVCNNLKKECIKWQFSAEESEKNRKELINACTLLTTRLEELSTFLESLLPSLGSKKRRMLQQAIDRSREMSRSFSFMDQSNLSLSVPLLPDVSQVDFCSGDETLTNLGEKSASENEEVTKLRNQVKSLVEKLNRKEMSPDKNKNVKIPGVWNLEEERLEDISEGSMLDSLSEISESNLATPSIRKRASLSIIARPAQPDSLTPLHLCLSESDGGWSEPDRNVSKERIGINNVSPSQKLHVNSSEESVRSNKKSPSGKKSRNEGLLELKRLSAKLDCLEQMNEALHTELQMLQMASATRIEDNNVSLNKPNSPKSLRDIVNKRRRSLEKSLSTDLHYNLESIDKGAEIDILSERVRVMSVQLESSCRRCLELEERCFTLESERQSLESRLKCADERLKTIEAELELAQSSMKEKENYLLEKQCTLLEANNNNILLTAKLETITQNLNMKQEQIEKYEREISEKDEKSKELHHELDELKKQSEAFESELKSRLETCQHEVEEAVSRKLETERRLIESYELQTDLRAQLDQELVRKKDMENHLKHEERCWRRRLSESEALRAEHMADMRRKHDAAVLTTSEAVLERTRLANDRLKLQHDLRTKETTHLSVIKELEKRIAELETLNSELEAEARIRWEVRQEPIGARSPTGLCSPPMPRSPRHGMAIPRSPTFIGACLSPPLSPRMSTRPPQRLLSNPTSDYVSDQEHPYNVNTNFLMSLSGRCDNNCSPDLGIESDNHSLATNGKIPSMDPLTATGSGGYVSKLELENKNLREYLLTMRKALADAVSKLTSSNQKKRQVERAICKQIHKTHHVLQKARVNFEANENQPPSQ